MQGRTYLSRALPLFFEFLCGSGLPQSAALVLRTHPNHPPTCTKLFVISGSDLPSCCLFAFASLCYNLILLMPLPVPCLYDARFLHVQWYCMCRIDPKSKQSDPLFVTIVEGGGRHPQEGRGGGTEPWRLWLTWQQLWGSKNALNV